MVQPLSRRALLRGALSAAGGVALCGCGRSVGPPVEVALAGVPGNGYVVALLVNAVHWAASAVGVRVRVTQDADWRRWVADPGAALPGIVVTAASGLIPALAGRWRDLGPVLAEVTGRGDRIASDPWTVAGVQAALPVLYDPLLLLAADGLQTQTEGQGFPFLDTGWLVQDRRVEPWSWNPLVLALAADQNRQAGSGGGLDLGLPDTGPALAVWLAAGWGQVLAGPDRSGNWRAAWADGLRAPQVSDTQAPTLPNHGPRTAMEALLTLLGLSGWGVGGASTARLRFVHACRAAGPGGLRAGAALVPEAGWHLVPLPVLPRGGAAPARYLLVGVGIGAPSSAVDLVRELLTPTRQLEWAQSGWGLPATATGFLQWAMTPYGCHHIPAKPTEQHPRPGGWAWGCAPLPVATPVECVAPSAVFGERTAANAPQYDVIQADLLAALAELPRAGAVGGAAVLADAATAANTGQTYGTAGSVVFPGF